LPKKRKKVPKRKTRKKAKRRKARKVKKTSIYTKLGKAVWKALSSKNYLKLLSI
jgi:hypothetical protein